MSTKKKTNTNTSSSTQFDPQSMTRYQGWQGSMFPQLQNLFSNPFGSQFFQLNNQQQQKAATSLAGRSMGNALMNFGNTGVGSGLSSSAMRSSLLNSLNRFGSQMQYQGFMNSVNQAQSDRWNAASLGSSLFQPLVTGNKGTSNTTETTSGLGTWLPQVAGAALGLATGGMSTAINPLMKMGQAAFNFPGQGVGGGYGGPTYANYDNTLIPPGGASFMPTGMPSYYGGS